MKIVQSAAAALMIACLAWTPSLAVPQVLPKYAPPVEKEPGADPKAWFMLNPATGSWCAFPSYREARAWDEKLEGGSPQSGWVRHDGKTLTSITHVTMSEDAVTEDLYLFNGQRITGLKRTGHYIEAPWATYEYLPDADGKLVMTPAARKIVSELTARQEETYVVTWPVHNALREFPFRALLKISGGTVSVDFKCTPETGPVRAR